METTSTHDIQLFSAMVNLLVTSGREEKDYGFHKNRLQKYGMKKLHLF